MHRALIVPPPETSAPAAGTVAHAVYEARLYNLAEYVDSTGKWHSTIRDGKTQGSFDLIIFTEFGAWPSPSDATAVSNQYAKARTGTVNVDWTDLGDFDEFELEKVLVRSRGGSQEDLEKVRSEACVVVETMASPSAGRQQPALPGGRAPTLVVYGDQILALCARHSLIDAQPATWSALDVVDPDDSVTWAISADGRAVVVLEDEVLTPHWLTVAAGRPYIADGFSGQAIPRHLGGARVITLALLRCDVLRLSLADQSRAWRLFVRPFGECSVEELTEDGAGQIQAGVDVVGDLQLFDENGRLVGHGPPTFGAITKIRAVDASIAGGRGLAAVLGNGASGPTLAVFRRGLTGTWKPIDVSAQVIGSGIDPADISDVTVERRLDKMEPGRVLVVANRQVHVIEVSASDEPNSAAVETEDSDE